MSGIISARRVTEELLEVECSYFGETFTRQLWVHGKARKHARCEKSDKPISTGDSIYRPFGNKANRSMRVLAAEVEKMLESQQ
ncbi:DUF3331 domain-containing protein [Edwardsiella phage vB_EpM_ZHS]|jgi:hypothetical protein|nr:DUF3331 domain-containing protein [Edwardsiella phage vB_EpM_ZHS]